MVPYNDIILIGVKNQCSERVNDLLKFTACAHTDTHTHTQMAENWNLDVWAPGLLTSLSEQLDTRRHHSDSLFSDLPSSSFQGKPVRRQVLPVAGPSCYVRARARVCLIHLWRLAMEHINKQGKPERGILMTKWSDLSSEIIVWNCLCQLLSFCSVLQGPVCGTRKVPTAGERSPWGSCHERVSCACLSSRCRQRVGRFTAGPAEHARSYLSLGTL